MRWLPYLFAALPGLTVGKAEAVSEIDRVLRQVVRVEVTGRTGVLYSLSSYISQEKDMCTAFTIHLTLAYRWLTRLLGGGGDLAI